MRIAVTRPEEDAGPLKAKLEAIGHEVTVVPLLAIVARPGVDIEPLPYQAIAVTSANAIRSLSGHHEVKSLRILTVGPQSLKAARAAGFKTAEVHGGDVDGMARYVRETLKPTDGPILYLSGAETTGDLHGQLIAAGFDCRRAILYDAVPACSLGAVAARLKSGEIDAVLLYSPRSARIWCDLVAKAGLLAEAALPRYLCLSRNVAAVLPETWFTRIAATPDDGAMLALLEHRQRTR